jgi:peptide deformylase
MMICGGGRVRRAGVDRVQNETHHSVLEAHYTSLRIGEAAIVEDLEEELNELLGGLLELVDEDDRVGFAAHIFGKLTALVVPYVSRRRADETRDGVLFAVLRALEKEESKSASGLGTKGESDEAEA